LVDSSFKFTKVYDELKNRLRTIEYEWDIPLNQQTKDSPRSCKAMILTSKLVVAATFYECLRFKFETDEFWKANQKRPTVSCYYAQMGMKKRDEMISGLQEEPMIDEDGNPILLMPHQVSTIQSLLLPSTCKSQQQQLSTQKYCRPSFRACSPQNRIFP